MRDVYGPNGKQLKKIATDGTETHYIGADLELKFGVWTKYFHEDVKREGTSTTWVRRRASGCAVALIVSLKRLPRRQFIGCRGVVTGATRR
ncbi:MAG: hypothetical protein AAFQ42_02335 [Pseudomonadota bacterium]